MISLDDGTWSPETYYSVVGKDLEPCDHSHETLSEAIECLVYMRRYFTNQRTVMTQEVPRAEIDAELERLGDKGNA